MSCHVMYVYLDVHTTYVCMVWYGTVWYGMVQYGMVWYGMLCYVMYVCIYMYPYVHIYVM